MINNFYMKLKHVLFLNLVTYVNVAHFLIGKVTLYIRVYMYYNN